MRRTGEGAKDEYIIFSDTEKWSHLCEWGGHGWAGNGYDGKVQVFCGADHHEGRALRRDINRGRPAVGTQK
mgnify:FL=1